MIDLNKTYKTADGREVRLSFEDNGVFHGHIKNPPPGSELPSNTLSPWMPNAWDTYSHYPAFGRDLTKTKPDQWEEDMKLIEQVPSKQMSVTIYISKGGYAYLLKDMPDNPERIEVYASCVLNFAIEEGANKRVVHIPDVIKR